MAGGVLGAPYVEVHLAPVAVGLGRNQGLAVARIHIAQIVGRRACETGHGVEFKGISLWGTPVLGTSQRGLAALCGEIFVNLGELQRQRLQRQHLRYAVLIIYGERLAPVALTREDGIAQTVVYLHAAYSFLLDEFLGGRYGLLHLHAVEVELGAAGIGHAPFLGVETLLRHIGALDQRHYREVEMARESIVARVMRGHSHDGACTVAGKHVVAHIHRNLLARKGIDGIGAGEHAAHLLIHKALALRLALHLGAVGLHSLALSVGGDHIHIFALGSEHHEGDSEHGVGPGGEDGHLHIRAVDAELHLGALRAPYPVALGLLDGVGPLDSLQVVEQTRSVGAHAQTPLVHQLLLHGVAATHRYPLAYLVVGQHSAEFGAPVHHRVAQISYAVVHQSIGLLLFVHGLPLVGAEAEFLAACGMHALGA